MDKYDPFTAGVILPVVVALPLYVTEYFPPDDGHAHPGHEHVETNASTSQVSAGPMVTVTQRMQVFVALTGVEAQGQVG